MAFQNALDLDAVGGCPGSFLDLLQSCLPDKLGRHLALITGILAKKRSSDKAGTREGEGFVLSELC